MCPVVEVFSVLNMPWSQPGPVWPCPAPAGGLGSGCLPLHFPTAGIEGVYCCFLQSASLLFTSVLRVPGFIVLPLELLEDGEKDLGGALCFSCGGHCSHPSVSPCEGAFSESSAYLVLSYLDTSSVVKTNLCVQDLPGGSVVENLPANAEDMGSIPDPGRSHMLQSNWACAPQLLSLCSRAHALQQEKPLQWEACELQLESSPCSPQEKSPCSSKDPAQPK